MPEQLSIFELIANASALVQLVMAVLVLASLTSWVMIFQRWIYLRRVAVEVDAFEDHFWSGIDLRKFFSELDGLVATWSSENSEANPSWQSFLAVSMNLDSTLGRPEAAARPKESSSLSADGSSSGKPLVQPDLFRGGPGPFAFCFRRTFHSRRGRRGRPGLHRPLCRMGQRQVQVQGMLQRGLDPQQRYQISRYSNDNITLNEFRTSTSISYFQKALINTSLANI